IPAALWIILPLAIWALPPLPRGLGVASLYEYLEMRFSGRVRLIVGLAYFVWQLTIIAGLTALPCRAVLSAAGWSVVPAWWLVVFVGATATLIAFLGGMRAVVWSGAAAAVAMAVAAVLVIVAAWVKIDGGPARVASIATGLGRSEFHVAQFAASDAWSPWAAIPFWSISLATVLAADQG